MRTFTLAIFLVAASTAAFAQQQDSKKNGKLTITTLTGCVEQNPAAKNQYTISDESGTYRLAGKDVREFLGKRVEIAGAQPKLVIKGGLYPTPNVAAQAGSMDPSRAAVAAAEAGPAGTNAAPLPEFRVQSIKPVAGNCARQ
jgi:hypothetical protein